MHRQHVVHVELLKLRHHRPEIVGGRRRQVEAADQRVDLLDARDLPRPFSVLMMPACPQELSTTNPRSPRRKQMACSCQC